MANITPLPTTVAKIWTTQAGLEAVIILHRGRNYNGYVGVSKDHLLHGIGYDENSPYIKDVRDEEGLGDRSVMLLFGMDSRPTAPSTAYNVHGGLTYSGHLAAKTLEGSGINTELWYFGYDCAHAGDGCTEEHKEWERAMGYNYESVWEGEVFRDLDFNIAQCESLAQQIVDKLVVLQIGHESKED